MTKPSSSASAGAATSGAYRHCSKTQECELRTIQQRSDWSGSFQQYLWARAGVPLEEHGTLWRCPDSGASYEIANDVMREAVPGG